MLRSRHLQVLTGLLMCSAALQAQVPIGQWEDDFQYQNTIAVAQADSGVYCATSTAVFLFNDATWETERYTKVNALSDVGISTLGWNEARKALVIGYRNGNVDIISKGAAHNLPDIKRSSIVGDKGVYAILNRGDLAYLSCGFGIVVMDLGRNEVKETWIIGPGGAQLQVNDLAFFEDSVYAATAQGIYTASQQATNLADYNSWHKLAGVPGADGAFTQVIEFGGELVVNRRPGGALMDTVYTRHEGAWQVFQELVGMNINALSVSDDGLRITTTQRDLLRQFDTQHNTIYFVNNYQGRPLNAMDGVQRRGSGVWIATNGNGLIRHDGNATSIAPNGPANNIAYRMAAGSGQIYVTTGAPSGNWGNTYSKEGVHRYAGGEWSTTNGSNDPLYASGGNQSGGSLNDVLAVVVDPDDGNHAFVGSWDDGVVEFRDGHITTFYGPANSTLQRTGNSADDHDPTYVAGLAYDINGNLWVANANCPAPISVRMKNGNWYSMGGITALGANTLLSDMIVDRNGYKWIIRPRGSGLLLFSDNGTPTDPSDDRAKAITNFEGQGHLPSMDVYSVAEDLDGQIWVGTNKGIAVFYNGEAAFTEDGDAQQILLEQDGNVQILLETEAVSAIAVDGANTKWLGTQSSGLYHVSADGTQLLEHFTTANSPLPSDNISCLVIDGITGVVYIGTDQGIMSYRGTATEGSASSDCVSVFPNPVRSTFTGPVAITGLVRGSDVRVTDVAGNLVYHTISNGGQALWPGTNMHGERVASGIYLVLAVDPSGSSKCNTKVAFVH